MFPEFLWQQREFLTHLVTFAIFFWIMKRFAWSPLTRVLDERQKRIEDGFKDIERRQNEARNLQEEYNARLREIQKEARQKMQEAVNEGKRVAEELTEQARRESAQIREQAERSVAMEMEKARRQLREDVVRMTVMASERLIREKLDEQIHQKMVDNFIEDIENRLVS